VIETGKTVLAGDAGIGNRQVEFDPSFDPDASLDLGAGLEDHMEAAARDSAASTRLLPSVEHTHPAEWPDHQRVYEVCPRA
jgi:hypothetical protein